MLKCWVLKKARWLNDRNWLVWSLLALFYIPKTPRAEAWRIISFLHTAGDWCGGVKFSDKAIEAEPFSCGCVVKIFLFCFSGMLPGCIVMSPLHIHLAFLLADCRHITAVFYIYIFWRIKSAPAVCSCGVESWRWIILSGNRTTRWHLSSHVPADWETKRPFGMTTLSSEFLAQSTIPLRPFMGKLMSVITDTAGSLWMLATADFKQTDQYLLKWNTCITKESGWIGLLGIF